MPLLLFAKSGAESRHQKWKNFRPDILCLSFSQKRTQKLLPKAGLFAWVAGWKCGDPPRSGWQIGSRNISGNTCSRKRRAKTKEWIIEEWIIQSALMRSPTLPPRTRKDGAPANRGPGGPPAYSRFRLSFTTTPPFITNCTRSKTSTFCKGSSSTAIKSA